MKLMLQGIQNHSVTHLVHDKSVENCPSQGNCNTVLRYIHTKQESELLSF